MNRLVEFWQMLARTWIHKQTEPKPTAGAAVRLEKSDWGWAG